MISLHVTISKAFRHKTSVINAFITQHNAICDKYLQLFVIYKTFI